MDAQGSSFSRGPVRRRVRTDVVPMRASAGTPRRPRGRVIAPSGAPTSNTRSAARYAPPCQTRRIAVGEEDARRRSRRRREPATPQPQPSRAVAPVNHSRTDDSSSSSNSAASRPLAGRVFTSSCESPVVVCSSKGPMVNWTIDGAPSRPCEAQRSSKSSTLREQGGVAVRCSRGAQRSQRAFWREILPTVSCARFDS